MIKNLNEIDEMCGVSGVEDVKAYKRHIEVKPYNMFDNSISEDFHTFMADRFLFAQLNTFIRNLKK